MHPTPSTPAAPLRTGDAVAAPPPQQIPFQLLLCQKNGEGHASLLPGELPGKPLLPQLLATKSKSHTLSPAREGQDPTWDSRALCSLDNSPLSHGLPHTALSLKYRHGSPAQSRQCPRAMVAGTAPPNYEKPQRKTPAVSGQMLVCRMRHRPPLLVMAGSKEPVHPSSLAAQTLSCTPPGKHPFPSFAVSVNSTFSP